MSQPAENAANKVSSEMELQALPNYGSNFEPVDGELVMSPENNFQHGCIATDLLMAVGTFARTLGLGVVLGGNIGCRMKNRNCRGPDIAFVSKARLKEFGFKPNTKEFLPAAPDLAVEILSPSNTRAQIGERLKDFVASGSKLVWIIDPEQQCVEVCHSDTDRKLIGRAGLLDGENLLPGFRYPIANLFKQSDWE